MKISIFAESFSDKKNLEILYSARSDEAHLNMLIMEGLAFHSSHEYSEELQFERKIRGEYLCRLFIPFSFREGDARGLFPPILITPGEFSLRACNSGAFMIDPDEEEVTFGNRFFIRIEK